MVARLRDELVSEVVNAAGVSTWARGLGSTLRPELMLAWSGGTSTSGRSDGTDRRNRGGSDGGRSTSDVVAAVDGTGGGEAWFAGGGDLVGFAGVGGVDAVFFAFGCETGSVKGSNGQAPHVVGCDGNGGGSRVTGGCVAGGIADAGVVGCVAVGIADVGSVAAGIADDEVAGDVAGGTSGPRGASARTPT